MKLIKAFGELFGQAVAFVFLAWVGVFLFSAMGSGPQADAWLAWSAQVARNWYWVLAAIAAAATLAIFFNKEEALA